MLNNEQEVDINSEVDNESEKNRGILMEKMQELEKRNNIVNSRIISKKNEVKLSKEKTMAYLFKLMEEHGVNLDDRDSISNFIQDLEKNDPDLKDLFEYAFNNLTTEEDNSDTGLMDKFNNLGNNIMMPSE